ncbi:hypothetical protein BDA99DRAFT_501918 [Phascolomyces articulosus]|uniref:Mitochondrial group I intron splicing factor CCM1 n=1 Tax=Phascolomyces articulosus TaxID=60185 RepID=A0AAD5K5G7_9FUNG|nr:hypothetical protein BDA99DRAFT_501918 [Phascolomyces articulosus]
MLSRTGTRACLSVGRRRIPTSLRHTLSNTRVNDIKSCPITTIATQQQHVHSTYTNTSTTNSRRSFATKSPKTSHTNEELATLSRAIEQNNIIQTRKSFSLLRSSPNDRALIDRPMIQKVLMLVRKGQKQSDLAFVRDLVETMQHDFNIRPELFEYHALMYAYGIHERPQDASNVLKRMTQMPEKDIYPNTVTYNILLGCYKRVNDYETALRLFEEMERKKNIKHDLVTYNTLLHFVPAPKALELYVQMQKEKIQPDGYTYSTILSVATREKNSTIGNSVYKNLLSNPKLVKDTITVNSLLAFKANQPDAGLNGVLDLYYRIPKRFPHIKMDVASYNIMLDTCLKYDNPGRAFMIFDDLKSSGCTPDVVTYGTLMDAEARQKNMKGALSLFDDMTYRNITPNARVLSSLANLASQETDSQLLSRVCDIIPKYSHDFRLDTKAYNGLLSGLAKHGRSAQAQTLYDEVFRHNAREADIATFTNLMLAYINDDQLDDAMDIYYELREHCQNAEPGQARITLDTTFYTSLISAMTALSSRQRKQQHNDLNTPSSVPSYAFMVEEKPDNSVENLDGTSQPNLLRALTLFNDMRRLLIRPNAHVYTAMLNACAKYRDAYALEQIHRLIRMDLYFDPDTAVYNALMDAYNHCGDGHVVLQLWDILMLSSAPKIAIDQATISVVLDSCGHNGYSHKAHGIWRKVKRVGFDLNTNNYNSYIECLCRQKGRQGWEEARRVVLDEMRAPSAIHDPRPPFEEKTLNTLIGFARKKEFKQEEVDELEQWKQQLLS